MNARGNTQSRFPLVKDTFYISIDLANKGVFKEFNSEIRKSLKAAK